MEALSDFEREVLGAVPSTVVLRSFRSFEAWYVDHVRERDDAKELLALVVDTWLNLNTRCRTCSQAPDIGLPGAGDTGA